ncbi:MAG: FecR family protein, partial [Gammaproteobacteria bacterium]|nr:FecR family protein [Gammaproteobacteria bacterium]
MHIPFSPARLACIALLVSPLLHAEECASHAGRFAALEGKVEVAHDEHAAWQSANLALPLCEGDSIRVGAHSRAAVQLVNDAVLRLDENTTMRLVDINGEPESRSLLDLLRGAVKSFSRSPRTMTVNTPYVNGMIEGTEFAMRVADDATSVQVFEGKVRTTNDAGEILLTRGQSGTARTGMAPVLDPVVRQDDAVQWTLYYPPLLATLGGGTTSASGDAVLDQALASAAAGALPGALAALEAVPVTERGTSHELARASLLLNVGQAAQAREVIDGVLAREPNAALALALRASIEVVQNQRDAALADAERAVAAGDSAATRLALSYAQQAAFRLDAARATLEAAATAHPDDALVQAR